MAVGTKLSRTTAMFVPSSPSFMLRRAEKAPVSPRTPATTPSQGYGLADTPPYRSRLAVRTVQKKQKLWTTMKEPTRMPCIWALLYRKDPTATQTKTTVE